METPSQELARIIVQKLVAEKVIGEKDAASVRSKLADGSMKADDWRLQIEKASRAVEEP